MVESVRPEWKADDAPLPASRFRNPRAAYIAIRERGATVALVVSGNGRCERNAALIARAVNSHDALVAALRACAERMERDGWDDEKELLAQARAALAQAEQG